MYGVSLPREPRRPRPPHNPSVRELISGKRQWSSRPKIEDTYMRDAEHERKTIRYIENNPTKTKLVLDPKDWPWSSARFRDELGVLRL